MGNQSSSPCVNQSKKPPTTPPLEYDEFIEQTHQLGPCQSSILVVISSHARLLLTNLESLESDPSFNWLPLPDPYKSHPNRHTYTVGCCNRLVCISEIVNTRFVLVNPSIGTLIETAPFDHLKTRKHKPTSASFGFGYDACNDDYKIVGVMEYYVRNSIVREVAVFSLRNNSWRVVETTKSSKKSAYTMEKDQNGILLDNHLLHWIVRRSSDDHRRILCFDLQNEKWVPDDISVPVNFKDNASDSRYHYKLAVLQGYLCLLVAKSRNYNYEKVDLWAMKEYGVVESWVTLLSLSHQRVARIRNIYPLCYREDSKEILLCKVDKFDNNTAEFVWYKTSDEQFERELELDCDVTFNLVDAHVCLGSL